jgi:hypothetical protein
MKHGLYEYFVMSAHRNEKRFKCCDISGFRHEVDHVCAVMGHHAQYTSNSLPTVRDNLSVVSNVICVCCHFTGLSIFLLATWLGIEGATKIPTRYSTATFIGHLLFLEQSQSPVSIWIHWNVSALKRNNGVLGSVEQWLFVNMNNIQPAI